MPHTSVLLGWKDRLGEVAGDGDTVVDVQEAAIEDAELAGSFDK